MHATASRRPWGLVSISYGILLGAVLANAQPQQPEDGIVNDIVHQIGEDEWSREIHRFVTPYGRGLDSIIDAAVDEGWPAIRDELARITRDAYEDSENQLEDWYYLFKWADILAKTNDAYFNEYRENHENSAVQYIGNGSQNTPLGNLYGADFLKGLMGKLSYSRKFFNTLHSKDYIPGVIDNLHTLYRGEANYARYENLALAYAVVYDASRLAEWPHQQVNMQQLDRRITNTPQVFRYFAYLNDRGESALNLSRQPVSKLKYLVIMPAIYDELDWVREEHSFGLNNLQDAYLAVDYDHDRYLFRNYNWQEEDYQLWTILDEGGICVDQAYFAEQTARARGIPAVIIRGSGDDGRHAWLGHATTDGWSNEVGRYGTNRYVQGFTYDPQTWENITEEALIRQTTQRTDYPARFEAALLTGLGDIYSRYDDLETATQLIEEALAADPRYEKAWLYRMALAIQTPAYEDEVLDILYRAMNAFEDQPEERANWSYRLSRYLEETGREGQAQRERYAFSIETRLNRLDLAIRSAAEELAIARDKRALPAQEKLYNSLVAKLAKEGGMDFFDAVVRPHVFGLLHQYEFAAALRSIDEAESTFEAPADSMLLREVTALRAFIENL